MSLISHLCPVCQKVVTKRRRKFCSRACVSEAYRLKLVTNTGLFKVGALSLNKGRTLESWVGQDRTREIKAKMSQNSQRKIPFLKKLNADPEMIRKRVVSRKFHDEVVLWLATRLRETGVRVFILSEYVKEKRIPDAILFDQSGLVALEVETEKRWKPSHPATEDRLSRLNSACGFFDRTVVVFPKASSPLAIVGPEFLKQIAAWERLN